MSCTIDIHSTIHSTIVLVVVKNAIGDALNGAMVEQPMKGADLPFINAVVLGFAQQ